MIRLKRLICEFRKKEMEEGIKKRGRDGEKTQLTWR